MRNLFTTVLLSTLTFTMSAQTDAGTFYLSFSNVYAPMTGIYPNSNNSLMSFGSSWITGIEVDGDDDDDYGNDYWEKNDEKDKTSTFNIGSRVGFFASDGLLLGIGLEYSTWTNKTEEERDGDGDGIDDEYSGKANFNSILFSPFAKYYITEGSQALFVSSSYIFGSGRSKSESESNESFNGFYKSENEPEPIRMSRWEFGAGLSFFLTDNISLEPSINYGLNTYRQDKEEYQGTNQFGVDWYDDEEHKTMTRSFYFKLAGSIFL